MSKIKALIFRCWNNHVLRYIFFGGCSTLVNLIVYYALRYFLHMPITPANVISIAVAMVFAYFVNSRFVFESKADKLRERFFEFVKFVGARLSTMAIEVGGVWLMADVMKINDYLSKLVIQFIIMVLNYVFSKFLVFRRKNDYDISRD